VIFSTASSDGSADARRGASSKADERATTVARRRKIEDRDLLMPMLASEGK
jgi:hypothetical protein